MLDNPERRQHKRTEVGWSLAYICMDNGNPNVNVNKGTIVNVGFGGLYFQPILYDNNLLVNQLLAISIVSLSNNYNESFVVKGYSKIMRIDYSDTSCSYTGVALQFFEIPSVIMPIHRTSKRNKQLLAIE
jgi:hypothetical protein